MTDEAEELLETALINDMDWVLLSMCNIDIHKCKTDDEETRTSVFKALKIMGSTVDQFNQKVAGLVRNWLHHLLVEMATGTHSRLVCKSSISLNNICKVATVLDTYGKVPYLVRKGEAVLEEFIEEQVCEMSLKEHFYVAAKSRH